MFGFLQKIGHVFHTAAITVSAVFVKIFGHDAAQAFGASALHLLQSAEGVIVADAVKGVASLNLATGEEARAEALKRIWADSRIQASGVSKSIVNMLVELAVNTLKGHFTADTIAAPGPTPLPVVQ